MKALQKYSGPVEELSPPEQFLLIMSSVPRLNEKIHLLMLMHQFEVRPGRIFRAIFLFLESA